MSRAPREEIAARVVLAVALLASFALLLHYRLDVGFASDDWMFLKDRMVGGPGTLVEPHNEHVVIFHVAIYRVLVSLFGISSAAPIQVVSLAFFLASAIGAYLYMRDLIGEVAAVIWTIPLLFLGTAFDDLIWAFQLGFTLSIAAGLGALIAYRRSTRAGDLVAAGLLTVSVLTSSMGLPFLAAAVVLVLADRRRAARSFVALVPLLLYLAWFLIWGASADSSFDPGGITGVPEYTFGAIRTAVASLTGIHRLDSPWNPGLASLIAIVLAVLVVRSVVRSRRVPAPLLAGLAAGFSFWVLAGMSPGADSFLRSFDQSRYQYPSAIFLLMIVAGAFEGRRPSRRLLAGMAVVALLAAVAGLGPLKSGHESMRSTSKWALAALTALDDAGPDSTPEARAYLVPYFADISLSAPQYSDLERRFGSPAWSESELAEQDAETRADFDRDLAIDVGVRVAPGPARARCRPARAPVVVPPAGGTLVLRPSGGTALLAGRFGDAPTVSIGEVGAGEKATVTLRGGSPSKPWRIAAAEDVRLSVCD